MCRTPISTPHPTPATFSDPSASGGRIRSAGGYLQDNWTVNDRVTLNLGVRFDRLLGDIPELSAGATLDGIRGDTSFDIPNTTTYPGVEDLIGFTTWSPRAGLTFRADQSGKTVLKANYGRFYGKLATGMFNSMSPGATPTTTLRCNTATRAYDIPFSFVDNRINFSVNPEPAATSTPTSCLSASSGSCWRHGRQRVLRLEGGGRLHPPAGRARHLCAARHRRHLRRAAPST